MKKAVCRVGAGLLVLGAITVGLAAPASAHEARKVGKLFFVVGFGDEPAYAGQKNSVQLLLSDAATEKPIVDLGDTLNVEVSFGNKTMPEMPMEADFEVGEFGTPGDYRAFFFPTRPGKYTFHFTGAIHGQDIDESFTSGPDTFGEAEDPTEVEFPVKDPTVGQLAERLDQEVPRLDSKATDASDSADSSKTLTIVSLIVAVLALIVALVALARGRRTT